MRAVDTNVVVRLLARDDPDQTGSAEVFVLAGAWVSTLVLVETMWVLGSVYGLKSTGIATAIEMLLNHRHLVLQDRETVASALALFRKHPALGFSDCLVVQTARKVGHLPLATFDRGLAEVPGAQRLSF